MKYLSNSLFLSIVLLFLSSLSSIAQDSIQKTKILSLERVGVSLQKPFRNLNQDRNSLTFKSDFDFSVANKFPLKVFLSSLRIDDIQITEISGSQTGIGYFNGLYESLTAKSVGLGSYFNLIESSKFNLQLGLSFSYVNMFIVKNWNLVALELFDKEEFYPFFQLNYARNNAFAYGVNSEILYLINNKIQLGLDLGFNSALIGKSKELGGSWEIFGDKDIHGWYDHFYYGIAIRYLLK